jgi:hypothetical protein
MSRAAALTVRIAAGVLLGLLVAVVGVRTWSVRRWRPLTPVARSFLDAALAHDSARLAVLASDTLPVQWATTWAAKRPGDLRAASRSLRVAWGAGGVGPADSVIVVEYAIDAPVCTPYGGNDRLQFQFTRAPGGGWRVWHVGVPPC